jgi:alpha-glucosidase
MSHHRFIAAAQAAGLIVLGACASPGPSRSPQAVGDFISNVDGYLGDFRREREFVSLQRDGQVVEIRTSSFPIRVEVLKDDLIKLRYANSGAFGEEYTWSVDPNVRWAKVDYRVDEDAARVLIRAKGIQVSVQKKPLRVSVLDGAGKTLLENQGIFIDRGRDSVNQAPGREPQDRLILGARFQMGADEHFYGLGEKLRGPFDQSIDWRGRKRDPDATLESMGNHFEGADGGANGNLMVPFLLSTRGYGLFFDTAYKTYWEFDSPARDSWYVKADCDQDWEAGLPRCRRSEMRFYVMASPTSAGILDRYTEITGKPILPPRWMLGYLQSSYGYRNWGEVHDNVSFLRNQGFPLDAMFLDLQWFGGVPGVYDENGNARPEFGDCGHRRIGNINWSQSPPFDFSGFKSNLTTLSANGIHVVPIEEGYFDTCTENFQEAKAKGFLARKTFDSNDPALFANGDDKRDGEFGAIGYFGQVGMIDTANAEARNWFWSKHLPTLLDGAATYWTDLGEPERFRWWWKYSNGLWHQDVHNVWDLNRARSLFEGMSRDLPGRRPFILSRSGYAGSQRYGVGVWSADAPARLHWAAAQPSAHLSLSISGIPYTTSDIGGFGGFPVSSGEQFTRWLQMESFSSLTRAHGNMTVGANVQRLVNPVQFPEPFVSICRRYLLWREALIPYLYTHAREAFDTGMPILRALPLEWPNDTNVQDLGSEYLFGPSILVAPVLTGQNNHPDERRDVYLPAGTWYDLHDGTRYDGGQWLRGFNTPLDKMPLFAREGAILPKGPAFPSVTDAAWPRTRTFEVYPGREPSSYMMYDDEGDGTGYQSNAFARTMIAVRPAAGSVEIKVSAMKGDYPGKPAQRVYRLEMHAEAQPKSVSVGGQSVAIEAGDSADGEQLRAVWNARGKKLFVTSPAVSTGVGLKWVVGF